MDGTAGERGHQRLSLLARSGLLMRYVHALDASPPMSSVITTIHTHHPVIRYQANNPGPEPPKPPLSLARFCLGAVPLPLHLADHHPYHTAPTPAGPSFVSRPRNLACISQQASFPSSHAITMGFAIPPLRKRSQPQPPSQNQSRQKVTV